MGKLFRSAHTSPLWTPDSSWFLCSFLLRSLVILDVEDLYSPTGLGFGCGRLSRSYFFIFKDDDKEALWFGSYCSYAGH